jgi:hypothetical protein
MLHHSCVPAANQLLLESWLGGVGDASGNIRPACLLLFGILAETKV